MFLGANTGEFYALDLNTGAVLWHKNLGWRPQLTCNARGIASTAAVALDDQGRSTVYVGGGDGYLYALDAATGAQRWRTIVGALPSTTKSDYYNWASPIVLGGQVYDGVSSMCDRPFVPGGLEAFDQATGTLQHSYVAVSAPALGGGVWTSPAADDGGHIFVTTGSGSGSPPGDMYSVVRLSTATLDRQDAWTLPTAERVGDSDWGSSPTVFTAAIAGTPTEMVAACNKNGILYAFDAMHLSAGPVWQTRIGEGNSDGSLACLPAPIWDGSHLLMAGPRTTINGVTYNGSMRALNPATGGVLWERGLGGLILGTPSVNGSGVIAAATYDSSGAPNGTYLLDASDGSQLNFLSFANSKQFAQPVFVGDRLIMATQFGGVNVYEVSTSVDTSRPSAPTGLTATSITASRVSLRWNASSDNVGVTGYRIFRNGTKIGQVPAQTTYDDSTVSPETAYDYTIKALDAAGNVSRPSNRLSVTTPASSSALFSDGFESGAMSAWTTSVGMVVENATVHAGQWAAEAHPASAAAYAVKNLGQTAGALDVQLALRVTSQDGNNLDLLKLRTASGGTLAVVYLTPTGRLALRNATTATATASTVSVSKNTWHQLRLVLTVSGGSSGSQVWLDDAPIAALSRSASYGTTPIGQILIGDTNARTHDVVFDDVVSALP